MLSFDVKNMATLTCRVQYLNDIDPFSSNNFQEPTRPPIFTFHKNIPLVNQISSVHKLLGAPHKIEDCALQIYHYQNGCQGDFGTYLDLESTIDEQIEEFEGFLDQRRNALILRTQLTVRVHAVIEKLQNSIGRELRRALFSLKQIFQDDKDLVHEFVNNDGLNCLIKVGAEADQNYQNYILRALVQVMLFVDGMNGVINHNAMVQWLYSLLASKYRLVVKTTLKLLLVFVEYTDSNATLLVEAIHIVDNNRMMKPWTNIMTLLDEKDGGDSELLVFTMTLVNKVLNALPDQDTFYDATDALEELGMESITQRHKNRNDVSQNLLDQFQLYEAALRAEDGEDDGTTQLENLRCIPRVKSENDILRKSRRCSTLVMPNVNSSSINKQISASLLDKLELVSLTEKSELNRILALPPKEHQQIDKMPDHPQQITQSCEEYIATSSATVPYSQHVKINHKQADDKIQLLHNHHEESSYQSTEDLGRSLTDKLYNEYKNSEPQKGISNNDKCHVDKMLQNKQGVMDNLEDINKRFHDVQSSEYLSQRWGEINNKLNETISCGKSNGESTNKVKSELELLASRNVGEFRPRKSADPVEDKSVLISQTMENLNKVQEPEPSRCNHADIVQTESDLYWKRMAKRFHRLLKINDMDFTDLNADDDVDYCALPKVELGASVCMPQRSELGGPPLPPLPATMPTPPPSFMSSSPPSVVVLPPPPMEGVPPQPAVQVDMQPPPGTNLKKVRKTVKLHWRVVHPEIPHPSTKGETIWRNIVQVKVDPNQLEHLFESKQVEVKQKRQDVTVKKEITILDPKRSNTINIGLTVLPPPGTIKAAILKMDGSIMNKEGIEKILTTMLPSEEEKAKILEAQLSNPDIPLGTAEQFLFTLSSINELSERLSLWLFKLDYETIEAEIAEPLMDLKKGIDELYKNMTLKYILSVILTIGNFLNCAQVRGFNIDYLSRLPEVKDTVHKHSILHHICTIILEQFTDSTDLYSDIGPITRCSRIDWDELQKKLYKLEVDCKASWDHLCTIIKYEDSSKSQFKSKMSEFLCDAAERIMILQIVYKRVMNRYYKLLLYMAVPLNQIQELKVNAFCKVLSEFALEYRTTREKVLQLMKKQANQRERRKTRGKMIVDMDKFNGTKSAHKLDDSNDRLHRVLVDYMSADQGLPARQTRRRMAPTDSSEPQRNSLPSSQGGITKDPEIHDVVDDEILEACVHTATTPSTRLPRQRKRARQNRKSLRRTLKNGLSADELGAVGDHVT